MASADLPARDLVTDYDPDSLPVEQARQLIRRFLTPVSGTQTVALRNALHRTLAADVPSPLDVPPHDNSAMDGYALRHAELAAGATRFQIVGHAYAGHAFAGTLPRNGCVRIMTGAPIPPECDCVIMQEQATVEGNVVTFGTGHRPGQNIRRAGEDVRRGETILEHGRVIGPAEMGVLASLGFTEITAYRKLRVAVFSTGDELRQPGETLAPGQIYDSNRYSLLGLLTELNVDIVDLGNVPDDPSKLVNALLTASAEADALITSGGVSVGEADYMKQLLAELGRVVFWKIAMKPGRPLAYGKIGDCHYFGLPGNPVAVMVTFQQFVRDALRILMGQHPAPALTFPVPCATPLRKAPGRTEFQRGILSQDANGMLTVSSTGGQSSGMLSSMTRGNCYIVLPTNQGDVAAGDIVQVQPFSS